MGIGQVFLADADRVDNFLYRLVPEHCLEGIGPGCREFVGVDRVTDFTELAMCQDNPVRPGKKCVGKILVR